eukprot:COSAG03_NODE_7880_length_861_cov_1.603675_2_plen_96_part_00
MSRTHAYISGSNVPQVHDSELRPNCIGHSLASSSFGRAVGSAYNSYEGFMDKHKVIHDITDDAALGLGVAGLTLATGGLGDAAVLTRYRFKNGIV